MDAPGAPSVSLSDPRIASLKAAVGRIQERFGSGLLERATVIAERDLARRGDAGPALATGIQALDDLTLAGGFPVGKVSLCLGPTGTGRMLLGYHLLAQTSRDGAAVLLLDLRAQADPWLIGRLGARLDRVLVLRPPLPASAGIKPWLEATLSLLRAGVELVVIDLPPRAGRDLSWDSFAPALATACGREGAGLLLLGEDAGEALRYVSSLSLRLRRDELLLRHGDLDGIRVTATVEKTRLGMPGAEASFVLRYPLGTFLAPAQVATAAPVVSDVESRALHVLAS
ncbi:MAG: P-loop NTPase family protein [Candidatus Dormibacteria bacterium]